MSTTIESLELQVQSSSQSAQSGLDALANSLSKLKSAAKGGIGLTTVVNQVNKLNTSMNNLSSSKIANLKDLVSSLSGLKSLQGVKVSSTIAKSIAEIGNAASGLNSEGVATLRELAPALTSLSSIGNVKISSTVGKGIASIVSATNSINVSELSKIKELADAVSSFASIRDVKISSSIATQVVNLAVAAELIQGVDFSIFGNLAEALVPLSTVERANLNSTINQLKKIPEVATALNAIDLDTFSDRISRIASALQPLATQMNAISSGFAAFPQRIQTLITSTNSLASANNSASSSYMNLYARLKMASSAVRGITSKIASWIENANSYIEDINLFNASMGQFAKEATNYANKVADVMGIDPGEWMRNQGVFMTLADGFGVAGDRAYTMSQQLTQLGYDLSSFFNITVADAMQKLQSGLAGELEPLRRLGYDLSQARLEAIALSLGIDKTYTSMTQAEKSQLRYYAIMTQVTTAQGDMARTLDAPANQLRVLQAQVTQAARAFGSVFIPILNAVLPVVIAVAKAIRILASAIASLFGFSLPDVDYSGITDYTGGVGDLGDALDSAGGSAEKLKSYLMGFDELNVIDPTDSSGGGGSGGGGGGGDWDWDLPVYDFLGDAIATRVDELMKKFEPILDWIKAHLDEILAVATAIGAELLMWKIAKALIPDLGMIRTDLKGILSLAVAGATIVVTAALVYHFDNQYMETGKWGFLIADGVATALGAFISGKVIANAYGGKAGMYTAAATVAISAATTLKVVYDHVESEGWDSKALTAGIWSVIKGGIAGGLFALAAGASVLGGVAIGAALTLSVGIIVALAASEVRQSNLQKELLWGKMTLTAEEIKAQAKKLFTIDVTTVVNLIETQIENEEQARTDVNEAIEIFNASVNKISIGAEVSQSDVDSMLSQLTGEDGVIAKLQKLVDEQKATIELAVSLVPPTTADGTDMSKELVNAIGTSDAILSEVGTDIGTRLSNAMQEGVVTGFSNGEDLVVTELTNWLNRISRAVANGKVSGEFAANVNVLLSDLSPESFSGVLDSYKELEAELKESYETLEKQAYADAVAYAAGLEQSKAYYESIGDYVNAAKVQDALDDVNSQIEKWDIGASVQKAVDGATPSGRQALLAAMQTIFAPASNEMYQSEWMQRFFDGWGSAESWEIDTNSIEELATFFQNRFLEVFDESLSKEDKKVFLQAQELMGINEWDVLGADVQVQFYNSLVEAFGASKTQEMLGYLGYDITNVIAKGISDGNIQIQSATEDTITLIGETIGEKTLAITPELLELFQSFGIDLSAYLKTGIETGTPDAASAAETLGTTVGETAKTAFEETTPDVVSAASASGSETGTAYVTECASALEEGKSSITTATETATSGVSDTIDTTLSNAQTAMTTAVDTACNDAKANVDTTAADSVAAINTMSQEVDTTVATTTSSMANSFSTLCESIVSSMTTAYTSVITVWTPLGTWFSTNVKTPVVNAVSLMGTEMQTKITTAKTNAQVAWALMPSWFNGNVKTPIVSTFATLGSSISSSFSTAKSSAQEAWRGMSSWFSSNVVSPIISSISNAGWYNAGREAANGFKNGLKSITLPNFHIEWSSSTKTVNGQTVTVPVPNLKFYKNGGFPATGQLFVAREAGAEMVGSIGGKSAVANNDQIVAAVSQGVYEAVRDAMREGDNDANVTVYLDGEVVYENQQKIARKKGYRFAT